MIELRNVSKAYEDKNVIDKVDMTLDEHSVYCLMGPSGRGKTTLLRLLAGLENVDEGCITGMEGKRISMVFQEDRLCEGLTPVENIRLVGWREPEGLLREILPESCFNQPVSELSGGMKRRVSVVRAMAAESDVIFMDEPFTGLDEETKQNVVLFIKKYRRERLILLTTHQQDDADLLGAEKIIL